MSEDTDAKARAFTALETFREGIEDAEDKPPTERVVAEAQHFEQLTDTLGECYAQGLDLPTGMFADTVAEVTKSLNKTDAKAAIARKSEEAKLSDRDRPRLDEWIRENLEEVRVVRTTDHVQTVNYVWDFGAVTVETQSGREGREHYGWSLFRDAIKDAGGPYLADPPEPLRDGAEWREWIVDQEAENVVRRTFTGPRTLAVNHLQDRVRRSEGYGTLADAADMGGCYVEVVDEPPEDAEPVDTDAPVQDCPEWRVDRLMVPNTWASEAVDENGISHQALQNELEARGHTLGGSKISTEEYVGGRYATFWMLDGSFAAPAAYQPEAVTPSASVGRDAEGFASDRSEDPDRDTGSVGGDS